MSYEQPVQSTDDMSGSVSKPEPDARDAADAAANEAQPISSTQPSGELKEGGYGWVVVLANALLNCHTWGLNSAFAVFLAYYLRNDIFEGATTLGFAFIGGTSIAISLLVSPLATLLVSLKGFGTRKTIWLGTIVETIAFIGASFTSQLWHILLCQGIAFGVGMGLIFVASVPVPSQWFTKRRSLANACAAAGSGFGGLIYSLGTNAMIASFGLAWTFRVLAIICFVVNSTCAYLVRDRNQAVGSIHIALNWALFKRPSFLLFEFWLILSMIPYCALIFSIVDYSQSVGLSPSQASLVGALLNLSQGLGRPLIGLSSDYVGRINVASFCTAFSGILCVTLWLYAKSFATCIVFALLVGGNAGVMWAAAAPVCAEVVGLPLLPSALSMSWLILVLPATFSEVIALELRNIEYRAAQLFVGFMYLAAFLVLWALRAWKVRELEDARLDKEERDAATHDDSVVRRQATRGSTATRRSLAQQSIRNVKAVWAVTRV